jgi:hypothetical protein
MTLDTIVLIAKDKCAVGVQHWSSMFWSNGLIWARLHTSRRAALHTLDGQLGLELLQVEEQQNRYFHQVYDAYTSTRRQRPGQRVTRCWSCK